MTILKTSDGKILRSASGKILRRDIPVVTLIKYGYMYNGWAALGDANGDGTPETSIASIGWHVPIRTDFDTFCSYVGNFSNPRIKEVSGTITWWRSDGGIIETNELLFNARGAGARSNFTGVFGALTETTYYWTTTIQSTIYLYVLGMVYGNNTLAVGGVGQNSALGLSVRLVKDLTTLTHGQTGTYTGNDGKVYRTICIGTQEWLADNLAETKYRNGNYIHGFEGGVYTPIANADWAALTTGALCVYEQNGEYR